MKSKNGISEGGVEENGSRRTSDLNAHPEEGNNPESIPIINEEEENFNEKQNKIKKDIFPIQT